MATEKAMRTLYLHHLSHALEKCYQKAEDFRDDLLKAKISEAIDRVHQLLAEV